MLVTPGLLPWIKASDIQASIKGSDHCPVFVDFHDEITTDAGEKLVLRDLMHMRRSEEEENAAKREPPRLAAKYWPEFQGKQTLVSSFFTKRGAVLAAPATTADLLDMPVTQLQPPSTSQVPAPASSSTQPATEPSPPSPPSLTLPPSSQASTKPPPQASQPSGKRPRVDSPTAAGETSKAKKLRTGQSKLSSFFNKPLSSSPPAAITPHEIIDLCEGEEDEEPSEAPLPTITSVVRPPPPDSKESESNRKRATTSWSALFTPVPPPLCTAHGEPTKAHRVKKPGPNKGRMFYLCARPVGPGYDKGRSERLREEVNYQYKCDFFKWASDAKREREAMRSSAGVAAAGLDA